MAGDSFGRPGTWLALDMAFLSAPSIQELGEAHGPAGPMAIVALFAAAKGQGQSGEVRTSAKALATAAFLDGPAEARRIVEHAIELGTLEEIAVDERRIHVRVRSWLAWQKRARDAERKAGTRATENDNADKSGQVPPREAT